MIFTENTQFCLVYSQRLFGISSRTWSDLKIGQLNKNSSSSSAAAAAAFSFEVLV